MLVKLTGGSISQIMAMVSGVHSSLHQRSKVFTLIIEGLGDVVLPCLGDRTPLEVSQMPFLDAIAGTGILAFTMQGLVQQEIQPDKPHPLHQFSAGGLNGLLDPVEPGLACGSNTALMSVLGYDPGL